MKEIVNLTPDLVACIGTVNENAAADYQQQKFLSANRAQHRDAVDQDATDATAEAQTVSIAPADALPNLHAQQREIIDRFVQCALTYVERGYPLLEGETVESTFATYLTEPFLQFPPGTAVIKRTTNMAELYYVVTNVLVDDKGNLYRRDPATAQRLRAPMLKLDVKSLATTAASKLVGGLAGAIGGAIGSYIFEQFFPPGVPSYFDEVYAQMSKLIGQGLQDNNINTINGAINSVKDHIANEYTPARKRANLEDRKDRKPLFDLLQKYDTTFLSGPAGMLGTLQSEQYSLAGFGVFLLGASLQLALFQEMANVAMQTKEGKFLKPTETSYGEPRAGTVATTARKFAEYGERIWPRVVEARVKGIDTFTYEANKHAVPGDVYYEIWGAIKDHDETKWPRQIEKQADKDGNSPGRTRLRQDKDSYIGQVKQELTQAYNDPVSITQSWRSLIDRPILLPA